MCQTAECGASWLEMDGRCLCCGLCAHLCRSPLLRSSQVQLAPAPGHLDAHCLSQALQALDTAVLPVVAANPDHPENAVVSAAIRGAHTAAAAARAPFIWEDGPLVKAMREGSVLLIDEVNLAEDAVLERLNSVLEPGRTLLLAEKGGPEPEKIVAAPAFRVIATMNPGGDHGKRELSPALSNRFTQVCITLLSAFWNGIGTVVGRDCVETFFLHDARPPD